MEKQLGLTQAKSSGCSTARLENILPSGHWVEYSDRSRLSSGQQVVSVNTRLKSSTGKDQTVSTELRPRTKLENMHRNTEISSTQQGKIDNI